MAHDHPTPLRQAATAAREALRGRLPPRYADYAKTWRSGFKALAAPALAPGAVVLDVGAGRRPVFPTQQRPDGLTYVGMDLNRSELLAAPDGSYDDGIACDVTETVPRLENQIDLIISRAVFEHVHSVPAALGNLYSYLKPGGLAVISLSGRYSAFGILNMLLPHRIGVKLVARVMRRDPQTIFPAFYDHCYHSALVSLLADWSSVEITRQWAGAAYFRSFRPVLAAYVMYEEWALSSGRHDLATHYCLVLRK